MTGGRPAADTDQFRPDLEGLRGLAILLVLLFHAGVPGTTGGFVGVDIFFVLSGFLITGLLLRERAATGRVSLSRFYARRARRILPSAAVVLVGTLAAAWLILPPLDLPRVADDAVAVALSIGNIRFAFGATDYFSVDQVPSPLLHYWSLGVEEQFYLVWPALLILAMRVRRPGLGATVAIGAVAIASFLASLVLTDVAAPWAFYSLPTRAWQLALGGMLAALALPIGRLPSFVLVPIGWLGLAAIIAALLTIDAGVAYPGMAALLPALGAAGLIAAGMHAGSPRLLLANGPMRFLGRISYPLYLVHWPLLVLPASGLAIGAELPLNQRVALVLLSIAIATVVHYAVEDPFRRARRLAVQPRRTLALAGAALAVTVLAGVAVGQSASGMVAGGSDGADIATVGSGLPSDSLDDLASLLPSLGPEPSNGPSGSPVAGSPGASGVPAGPALPAIPPAPKEQRPSGPLPLPADVKPSLAKAAADRGRLLSDGCELQYFAVKPPDCVYGKKDGAVTVALVGDSHASQWFPALERIARFRGWRLLPFTKFSCRFMDIRIVARELKREYTECTEWRTRVIARLQQIKPDLVVVVVARGPAVVNAADNDARRQGASTARMLNQIPGKKAIIVDTPQSVYEMPQCLSSHVHDVRPCETPRGTAFGSRYLLLENRAARDSGATLLNLSDWICPRDPCPVVLRGMIVYRDYHHMTATFAASLAPVLAAGLPRLP